MLQLCAPSHGGYVDQQLSTPPRPAPRETRTVVHYVEAPHLGGVELWVASLASSEPMGDVRSVVILGCGYQLHDSQFQSYAERIERAGGTVLRAKKPGATGLISLLLDVLANIPRGALVAAVFNHSFSLKSMLVTGAISLIKQRPRSFVVVHMNYSDFKLGLVQRASIAASSVIARLTRFSFIGVSKKVLEFFSFVPDTHRQVISPGLDPSELREAMSLEPRRTTMRAGALALFFVGRLDRNKNPFLAVQTVKDLRERGYDVRLTIVGDGPARAALEALVAELTLEGHVDFRGFCPNVLNMLWAEADVAIHTSRSEAFGLLPVEAQALGIPVVAADTVAEEAVFWEEGVRRLSLNAPQRDWSDAVLELAGKRVTDSRELLWRFAKSSLCNSQVAAKYRRLLDQPGHGRWKSV